MRTEILRGARTTTRTESIIYLPNGGITIKSWIVRALSNNIDLARAAGLVTGKFAKIVLGVTAVGIASAAANSFCKL